MTTTPATHQPAETIDLTAMPGRVVDVVHLAAVRAGQQITTFSLSWRRRVELTAYLDHDRPRGVPAARAVFAQLGVTEVTTYSHPGSNHATVTATVPALDDVTVVLVIDPIPHTPAPVDPAGLLTTVDAARTATAAADQPVEPAPVPQSVTNPTPEPKPVPAPVSRAGASGERAVRFEARFDSTCPACEQLLEEGAPASWLDGEVVHDTCAQAAGIDVYDPR